MIRVAAIADLHCREDCPVRYREWYRALDDEADVFVLAGDLTHLGRPEEARALANELQEVRVPIVAVLGNHDAHSDRVPDVQAVLRDAGVWLLDDGPKEVPINGRTVGFAGTKGFCGGFGNALLTPFGEAALKAFIGETAREADCLDRGLQTLRTQYRIAVLHYAPVRDTLQGEQPELYPFLGSSLLSEPIDRHGADLVLHGHAHHGSEAGHTGRGIPVRNVALPVLKTYYTIFELGS
jgi:Icc-related predicted phosphoesterase